MGDIDCILANVAGHDKTATRGPWDHNGRGTVWQVDGYAAGDPNAPDSRVAQANDADAALISYYRTAAPLLAAEVDRLRAEVERLQQHLDWVRQLRDEHDANGCETCCLWDAEMPPLAEALEESKGAER